MADKTKEEIDAEIAQHEGVTRSLLSEIKAQKDLASAKREAAKGTTGEAASALNKEAIAAENVVKQLSGIVKGAYYSSESLSKMGKDMQKGLSSEGIMDTVRKVSKEIAAFTSSSAGKLATAGAGIAGITLARVREHAIKYVYSQQGAGEIVAKLTEINKFAIQSGTSFTGSFTASQQSANAFRYELTKSIDTTKTGYEDIIKTGAAFRSAFSPSEMIGSLGKLSSEISGVNSTINLMNAALLIGGATGTDASEVSEMLAKAHLDLGLGAEEAVKSMGYLSEASSKSRLGFSRTANSILDSASSLKMWGGTIASVTPLFNAFNASLKGAGREGLTPELLQTFVDGLGRMEFGARALLGLRVPGMSRAGGVLGAGLKMEAALEDKTGEGMKQVMGGLMSTLKQFGGPQILTRAQAIENPSLERNFMIQRQLLGQLLGVNDPAKQTQMMGLLSDIDKHGMGADVNATEQLGKILSAGEKTAETTKTDEQLAALETQLAEIRHGNSLLNSINEAIYFTGADKLLKPINNVISSLAKGEQITPEMINRTLNVSAGRKESLEGKREVLMSVGEEKQDKGQINRLSKRIGKEDATAFVTKEFGKASPETTDKDRMEGVRGSIEVRINELKKLKTEIPRDDNVRRTVMDAEISELSKTIKDISGAMRGVEKKEKIGGKTRLPSVEPETMPAREQISLGTASPAARAQVFVSPSAGAVTTPAAAAVSPVETKKGAEQKELKTTITINVKLKDNVLTLVPDLDTMRFIANDEIKIVMDAKAP